MGRVLSILSAILMAPCVFSQTNSITKPEQGQSTYIVTGSATLEAIESITLGPGTHIQSGSTFVARVYGNSTAAHPYQSITLSNENYIFTRSFQKGMSSFNAGTAKEGDVMESVVYYDGLGRPMQRIGIKSAPDKEDLVTHVGYDAYGRQDRDWLPYYVSSGSLGSYRGDVSSATQGYYKSNYGADFPSLTGTNVNAYSQREYEPSPLNRVLKQAAPGEAWKLGGGHEVEFGHGSNTANEVRRFSVTLSFANDTYTPTLANNGYYTAGELYKNIVRDENHTTGTDHTTEEFVDKQGRVVLKRTHNGGDHDTYYVYDDYGNLTYVIPPKVTTDNVSATELNELCYQYVYDHRNRLVEKKLPGKGREYIVYNKLDQPIMTQDSKQDGANEWLFTQYDAFGRVAYTGIDTGNSSSRTSLQTSANGAANQYVARTASANSYAGTTVYYTKNAYPTSFDQVYTINYYDTYVDTDGLSVPGTVLGQATTNNVQGLPTVAKVRVLGTSDWITTITGYDGKGRAIYTASKNNYLNTTDIVETELDFGGKVVQTKTTHQRTGHADIVSTDLFEYDHEGRLLWQKQAIGGQAQVTLVENTYDDLGQLEKKKVGGGLQTVDYTYNVRGWLKQINNPSSLGSDLWAFGINYNEGANPQYNGNVSGTSWRSSNTDTSLRSYTYFYDPLNRLTAATGGAGSDYDVSGITYDKNGNIMTLTRNGWQNGSPYTDMDVLDYDYGSGNQLTKVRDDGNDSYGFKDGADQAIEFTYDPNGNLQSDANKGVTNITYNHFDLPTEITLDNNPNKKVNYVYAADRTKLRKIVVDGGPPATTDYAGNYIYENGSLQFMSHKMGYAVPDGNSWDYVYQYKDNLGNVRLTYSDMDNDGSVDGSEIMHERNPYPFGMLHKGYNEGIQGQENNYMEFQGQELDKSLGLEWNHFRYRTYDRALGKFLQIDPLATTYVYNSTYSFAENNPTSAIDLEGKEKSFELDGNRATLVSGPVKNSMTLQEAASERSKQVAQRDALLNMITPKADGTQSRQATIQLPSTHISRVALAHPQSGYRLAETVGVAAREAATDFFGGAIIAGGLNFFRRAGSVWNLNRFARGRTIENMLGANTRWARNFPVIDKIEDGVATSIKSVDLTAKSYQSGNNLFNTLKGYVDKLDNFSGAAWGNKAKGTFADIQEGRDFTSKALELAVESGQGSAEQWEQITNIVNYALEKEINVSIRFID
ncbi:RHS repeat-associated core domain-containing protein [Flagellimonas taeanensis]|uniref:RHS repeat-associated core domain-containing protein n=3 Tax=Flagellimonas taeanensis TaxID=1005926 RepID=A0A1I1IJE7_9FLAO|nr:DUF6443 domain-containing protein [Allomuricauda taeanensis]SFC36315.1 RHS repeat-associated core domain-containing protein [Allomuricauda taeanensis]